MAKTAQGIFLDLRTRPGHNQASTIPNNIARTTKRQKGQMRTNPGQTIKHLRLKIKFEQNESSNFG